MIDIRKLLEKGQAAQNQAHAEGEEAKRGNLRGGSAGVVGTDGKVYGECHRLALARLLGADKEVEDNRHIMFDAGRAAEDSWADKLSAAGVQFRREEEIPIVWQIPGTDRVVTGRPDVVLGATRRREATDAEYERDQGIVQPGSYFIDEFFPEFGIELKGIYSASSGVRVEIEGIPDPKHLAQAGFYSMALGVDYAICYTNPSVIEVPYWAQKRFSEYETYTGYETDEDGTRVAVTKQRVKKASPKKLQPFYRMFYLRWTDDTLEYRDEKKDEWVKTVYTKQGIAEFYSLVVELEQKKQLGPRPEGGYATGEALPYAKCKYCALSASCDSYEDDYEAWFKSLFNGSKGDAE